MLELPMRETHGYPPAAAMIRIVARGPMKEQTKAFAQNLGDRLRAAIESQADLRTGDADRAPLARVLGPAAAPIARLRGDYRFHLQMQGPSEEMLRSAVQTASVGLVPPDNVVWIADVDPLDML